MSPRSTRRSSRSDASSHATYWNDSRRPLSVLIFLLPLILVYELGLALVLRSDRGVVTNYAHEMLLRFFEQFGLSAAGGLYLGGVVIIVVLLVWHLLNRDPWQVNFGTIGTMAIEAIALTLPLLVLGQLIARAASPLFAGPDQFDSLDAVSRLTISVGAGLYEELLFRMLLIALLHTVMVDMIGASHQLGLTLAVVVSAAAFTWYHPLADASGRLSTPKLAFYFLAGLYFGAIFALRGFGIVVGVHALYDVVTSLLLSATDQ
jgi:hypothetical protein